MKIKPFSICLIFTILVLSIGNSSAQEVILPLEGNHLLSKQGKALTTKKGFQEVMVELPFMDDFSGESPYPDVSLWADSFGSLT